MRSIALFIAINVAAISSAYAYSDRFSAPMLQSPLPFIENERSNFSKSSLAVLISTLHNERVDLNPLFYSPKISIIPHEDTINWQTYTDAKYGFKLLYPPDFKILVSAPLQDYAYEPDDPPGGYDYDPRFHSIIQFEKSSGAYDDSENIRASFTVSIATSSDAITSCLMPPYQANYVDYSRVLKRSMNGIQYSVFDAFRDSAKVGLNGGSFGARYYRVVHKDICYSLTLSDSGDGFSSAPDFINETTANDEARRYGFPFSAWDVFDELSEIASTFQFTTETNP